MGERNLTLQWATLGVSEANLNQVTPIYQNLNIMKAPNTPCRNYPNILFLVLPSFIDVIYYQRAEDKENEQGNKHVVYCSDVVHLKQLTVNTVQMNKLIICI